MTDTAIYPPNPTGVPRALTRPGLNYLAQVAAMIAGLFAFVAVYLGLIAFAGWFAYSVLTTEIEEVDGRGLVLAIVLKYGGSVACGLLALFLVKGLFKARRAERTGHVRL